MIVMGHVIYLYWCIVTTPISSVSTIKDVRSNPLDPQNGQIYALSVLCTAQGLLFVAGGLSTWRVPRELCMRESSSNYSLNLVQSIHLTRQRLVQLIHYLKLKSIYQ